MSRRKDRGRTPGLWIATNELPSTGGHPFYQRLNHFLDAHGFDDFVEAQCAPFYAATVGRPSVMPGTYFRLRLIGYFEGIDSERGIAWRTADSLALRGFLGLGLDQMPPEHSTISRTRRLIDLETHRAVFTWILQVLATADLVTGKTIGIDATTLEANAALRSIEVAFRAEQFLHQGVGWGAQHAVAGLDQRVPEGAQRVALADAGQAERQHIGRRLDKRPGGQRFELPDDRRRQPASVERLERLAGRQARGAAQPSDPALTACFGFEHFQEHRQRLVVAGLRQPRHDLLGRRRQAEPCQQRRHLRARRRHPRQPVANSAS